MLKRIFTYTLLSLFCAAALAQSDIPNKPEIERLVNDFANVLNEQEENLLEQKLATYARESSTQIAIVTVKSLNGYERADFATRLAQKWGIGSAKHDNGMLLLVKPKYSDSKGEVFIATGYGLEGAATDLANGQIVRNVIIPHFKQNDYFGGIDKGTDALIALTKGEYNDAMPSKKPSKGMPLWVIIFLVIVFFIFISSIKQKAKGQYQMSKRGGSIPMWMLLEMLTRNRGKGDFKDFNSGSGGFGGFGGFSGGGGFGGFGGGSFGGGGAGGSW